MNAIQEIPRATVRAGLTAARLPLTTAETVLGRRGDEEWPPALAFEGFEATVKRVAGSLLHDPVLSDEGRLTGAKVDRLRKAVALEAVAEQRRDEADSEYQERLEADERRKVEAKREADRRVHQIEQEVDDRKRDADRRATAKAREAERVDEAVEERIERDDRRERLRAITAEEQALAADKAAAKRKRTAKAKGTQVRASKAARERR